MLCSALLTRSCMAAFSSCSCWICALKSPKAQSKDKIWELSGRRGRLQQALSCCRALAGTDSSPWNLASSCTTLGLDSPCLQIAFPCQQGQGAATIGGKKVVVIVMREHSLPPKPKQVSLTQLPSPPCQRQTSSNVAELSAHTHLPLPGIHMHSTQILLSSSM